VQLLHLVQPQDLHGESHSSHRGVVARFAHLPAAIMRSRLLVTSLVSLPLFISACASSDDDGPNPYDGDYPVQGGNINEGAPDNNSLPDDNKADAQYPPKFEVKFQSPVKSQGSRGVCSIFAATAAVENMYLKAGMPAADVDFSEQYLQWAAKNLPGAGFRNTEGSTSDLNLRMVVNHGTVKEAAWPYESAPWNASNDAACNGGMNLPTKCYTNGEPPASVAQAPKFKLPQTRWINTNSIKAHITAKGTGVNVGMDFFYQSWNHRRSTLPVNSELWRQGIVTFPNQDDITASHMQRAGHAIHIVGWDDDKEVDMRDKDGNPILDASGNPKKEKGFWIFKNSWGTASFGVDHPSGAGYGWLSYEYVSTYGSAVTADVPLLGATEVCDNNSDDDGDGATDCDDSSCASSPLCQGGGMSRTYNSMPNASIPDNNPAGISNTIDVTDTGTVADVKITVDISHTYSGDLVVSLVKGTTEKVVSANVGGSADDIRKTFSVTGLAGQSLAGGWTLKVVDDAAQDVGTLNKWTLEVTTN
jgi:hypothetical protein